MLLAKNDNASFATFITSIAVLAYICSLVITEYSHLSMFYVTAFSMVFSAFFIVYFHGNTRKEHFKHLWLYSALTLLTMYFAIALSFFTEPYFSILRALFLFICSALGRYMSGGRMGGMFLIVFFIIFYLFYPISHVTKHTFEVIITVSISVALVPGIYTLLYLAFPLISALPAGTIQDNHLFKIALRLTISFNVAYLTAHLINSSHAS